MTYIDRRKKMATKGQDTDRLIKYDGQSGWICSEDDEHFESES